MSKHHSPDLSDASDSEAGSVVRELAWSVVG
jgi:hypothetical protein